MKMLRKIFFILIIIFFIGHANAKEPIEFILGARRVIPGWEEGIQLLNVGAKATLIIPPELGWGSRGAGSVIPPNATTIFDVELIEIIEDPHLHDHHDHSH